jgi:membrane associated rhomboid family serine protease
MEELGSPMPETPELLPAREPIFNAPWPAVALLIVTVGGYGVQTLFDTGQLLPRWGATAQAMAQGRAQTLITALFLHGSWAHALMNGAFGLAFATPVARYFGGTAKGLLGFVLLYIVCGGLANLAFVSAHGSDLGPLVGASGAISALAAAAARIAAGRGEVGPISSPLVLGMGAGWIITNLITAITGLTPGAGGASVAWQVHLVGFALGLILIGPIGRLTRASRVD